MVKMIIAPLLFATLVVGIAGHGDVKQLSKIGIKTLVYFEIVTTLALFIGLIAGNIFKPGVGFNLGATAGNLKVAGLMAATDTHTSIHEMIINIFPTSIVDAMATGNLLQIVVFSIVFALAICTVGKAAEPVLDILKAIFVVLVLIIACKIAKISFRALIRTLEEPALLAFSTASSEAAFPKAIEIMEDFGVPKNIVGFVMPTGYTFNLDGSTLYLAIGVMFSAQIAGIHLGFEQQIIIMLALMLTSKGIAGVPRVSLIVLAGTLASFDIPIIGVAILLGIDQILDMGRTTVNLIGNCIATVVIARWENQFDYDKMKNYIEQQKREDVDLLKIE